MCQLPAAAHQASALTAGPGQEATATCQEQMSTWSQKLLAQAGLGGRSLKPEKGSAHSRGGSYQAPGVSSQASPLTAFHLLVTVTEPQD